MEVELYTCYSLPLRNYLHKIVTDNADKYPTENGIISYVLSV